MVYFLALSISIGGAQTVYFFFCGSFIIDVPRVAVRMASSQCCSKNYTPFVCNLLPSRRGLAF